MQSVCSPCISLTLMAIHRADGCRWTMLRVGGGARRHEARVLENASSWSPFIGSSTRRQPATGHEPLHHGAQPGVVHEAPHAAVPQDVLLLHPPRVHHVLALGPPGEERSVGGF
ncbi:hypothetical protein VPH35_013593 [Triticum aestivum]